jgi:hypothetical protein
MSYIPALLLTIETRLDESATEITRLEAALSALTTPTTTNSATSPTRSNARRQRRRASSNPTPTTVDPKPGAIAAASEPAKPITDTIDASEPEPADLIANGAASTARRRPRATSAPRGKRATAALNAETLQRLLASTTVGLSATKIADHAGASYPVTLKLLRELEAAGQVRRSGERRSTGWRAVTDEDRIAERAAELERATTAPLQRRGRARTS